MRKLELLSPAGNALTAIEAIKHGADAVYIGPPSHGARVSAANSLEDIRKVVDFAHIFGAKVYVTVNTLVLDHELKEVESMIRDLYKAGVDALIVQDMGILRMDIPPIALHASTQCDIRTVEKARFLEEAGFSQLVLARELTINEISDIAHSVSVPVEVFVHGALCVSYSGRCSAGFVCAGRSGNRGRCPQICRQSFSLTDSKGKVLAKDKYLLSLKDLNAQDILHQLVDAGVSSFKIEGRLKETGYVKNITAAYSRKLNDIIRRADGSLSRASFGTSDISFSPDVSKSFNRGFTDYMFSGKPDRRGIASMLTPKSLGEPIKDVAKLRPGDGISFFNANGEYCGVLVNGIKHGRIIGNQPFSLPENSTLHRTFSIEWKKLMASDTASRYLNLDVSLDATGATAADETGAMVRLPHDFAPEKASKPADYRRVFEKLGGTPFRLRKFDNSAPELFFPLSYLTALRRKLIEELLRVKRATVKFDYRRPENIGFPYLDVSLSYRDNVANRLAVKFYEDHGVKKIQPALETRKKVEKKGLTLMTTRHCILRELGLCLKNKPDISLPLTLKSGNLRFTPHFDCSRCEMSISSL